MNGALERGPAARPCVCFVSSVFNNTFWQYLLVGGVVYVRLVTAEKCVWVSGPQDAAQSGDAATSRPLSDL